MILSCKQQALSSLAIPQLSIGQAFQLGKETILPVYRKLFRNTSIALHLRFSCEVPLSVLSFSSFRPSAGFCPFSFIVAQRFCLDCGCMCICIHIHAHTHTNKQTNTHTCYLQRLSLQKYVALVKSEALCLFMQYIVNNIYTNL